MQLHEQFNLTPFRTDIGFCQDRDGRDLVLALLKATFHFDKNGRVTPAKRETSVPLFKKDVYYAEPATSSLSFASDVVPSKRGVDIAIAGHAYGHGAKTIQAGFRVGTCEKVLAVYGPRCWAGGKFEFIAGPLPFSEIPLRYEHAYGGSDVDKSGCKRVFDQNPIGVAFATEIREQGPLPNFEYKTAAIKSVHDRPPPAGFGFIPPGWKQRWSFAGTFDAAWESLRRPLFPKDFDERFYNSVPQDQVLRELVGNEHVVLRSLDRRAETVVFSLPQLCFSATFRIRERSEALAMKADTVLIEPDEERFSICFRATCNLGDDFRFLKSVTFKQGDCK